MGTNVNWLLYYDGTMQKVYQRLEKKSIPWQVLTLSIGDDNWFFREYGMIDCLLRLATWFMLL